MDFIKFGDKYIVRLDKGEEIVSTLKKFCEKENVKLGWIKGIGAVDEAKIGIFKVDEKKYYTKVLKGDYEITSLLGNISTMDGETYLHLHINLSDDEYKTYGGHLDSARISATGELIIGTIEGEVNRQHNEEIGINLYSFD